MRILETSMCINIEHYSQGMQLIEQGYGLSLVDCIIVTDKGSLLETSRSLIQDIIAREIEVEISSSWS